MARKKEKTMIGDFTGTKKQHINGFHV